MSDLPSHTALAAVLDHPHPYAQRVIAVASQWVDTEWQRKERIRLEAVAHGWTPQRWSAYADAVLTTNTLARSVDNVSLSKFRRALQDVDAPSPGQIIRAARLCHAERLLRETRLMVREVARRAGYSSEKHFATRFGLAFGCSPSDYRRKQTPGNPHE